MRAARWGLLIAVVLGIAAWPRLGLADQVSLRIANDRTNEEGCEITYALARVADVKVAQRVTKDEPTAVVVFNRAKADLGDLARAVAEVKVARRDKPSTTLIATYQRLDSNTARDDLTLKDVQAACAKLRGVDAKACKLDAKSKIIHVKLDDRGGAKLADIVAAFPDLALDAWQEPKPSTRLSSSDELPSIAANRNLEPRRLTSMVTGELDWIVMRALEKDRGHRYETANGLAMDIGRYLSDEPVLASPPSAAYRLKKFVRRNKGPVSAAIGLLLALSAGVVGTAIGLVRAENALQAEATQRQIAQTKEREALAAAERERLAKEEVQAQKSEVEAARDQEAKERGYAEAIATFVKDDFLALTSVEGQTRFDGEQLTQDATLRDLLDRAAEKLNDRKDLSPRTQAELCWIIGVSYRGIGEADRAVSFLERSVELHRQASGPEAEATLNAQNSLALAYKAAGQYDRALTLQEETLKLMQATLGPEHPRTLVNMSNLAGKYEAAGKLDLMVPLVEETLKLMQATLGPDHPDTLMSMNNLACAYKAAGKLDLALPLFEETLKLKKAKFGAEHPNTLLTANNLAGAYQAAGRLDLAVPLFEETLKLSRAKFGAEHPETLRYMNNLARAYQDAEKLDLALPLFEETLKLSKAKLGPEHPNTLISMTNLASAYQAAGKLDQALQLFEATLEKSKAKFGPDHPNTLTSMSNLASAYQDAGKLDRALPLFEETLKLRKAKIGIDHPNTLISMNNLANAYQVSGKLDWATPLFEQTLEKLKAKLGADHRETTNCANNLAWAYQAAGKLDLALPLFEETLKLRKAKFGAEHPNTILTANNLAGAYQAAGRLDLAVPLMEETLKLSRAKIGAEHPNMLTSMNNLAEAYKAAGQLDKALPLFEEALEKRNRKLGPDHPHTLISVSNLAGTLRDAEKYDRAVELWQRLWDARRRILSDGDRLTIDAENHLGWTFSLAGNYAEAEKHLLASYRDIQLAQNVPTDWFGVYGDRLADLYSRWGKLHQWLPYLEDGLKRRRAELGADHADTTGAMLRLAFAYRDCSDYAKAEAIFRELWSLQSKTYSPQHRAAIDVQSQLGWTLALAGEYAEAEKHLLDSYRDIQVAAQVPPQWMPVYYERLAHLYWRWEKLEQAEPWLRLQFELLRKQSGADHPATVEVQTQLGLILLAQDKPLAAEAELREALRLRDETRPKAWLTFNTKSLLGAALFDQKKYAEAEPLLLAGYEGLKENEVTIPPKGKIHLANALKRLVDFYAATGHAEKADEWRAKLEAATPSEPDTKP